MQLVVQEYSDFNNRVRTVAYPIVHTMEEIHAQAHKYRNLFFPVLRVTGADCVSRRYCKSET